MKVLMVIEDLGAGGAQRQLVNIALHLKHSGHDVSFLSYYNKNFYTEILNEENLISVLLPFKNPFKRIYHFRKFIRSGNYDAVIAFLGTPAFLAEMAAIPFKPFKLIVGERSANPKFIKSWKSRAMRFFHLFADYVVMNSFTNRDMIKKINPFIPNRKLKVIYNAIDLDKFKPQNEFIFKNDAKVKIIIPASYRRLKNLIRLIEAVNLLTNQEKDSLKIDWFGDKTNHNAPDFVLYEAEKLVVKYHLEQVFTFQDATRQIEDKIKQADVVGLFSVFEGLPNAICEGMACGKPVLSSNVSDAYLLIEDDINGKLCEPDDLDSIKHSLQYVIYMSREQMQQMGAKNRAKAIELFDSEKINNQYMGLLQ